MKTFQKPLSQAEEAAYFKQLRQGSPEEAKQAKDVLVERNLRLVAHIVKKYQSADEDAEDLISIGCIGLIKAIETFDVNKGRLATYACRCIDNEILMVMRSKKKSARDVSIFEPIGQDKEGNEIRLMDVLENEQPDILEEMELSGNIKKLHRYMADVLTSREREILTLRYGLGSSAEKTQSEVGEYLHISRSYVSRIEKKALQKLKHRFDSDNTK